MKKIFSFILSLLFCFSFLAAESSEEVERIFANKDYAAFEKYVKVNNINRRKDEIDYYIYDRNGVFDYIFKGDDTNYIDILVRNNCTRVRNPNIDPEYMDNEDGCQSLAAICALNNNIKLLKYCYSIGLHIDGEGKVEDDHGDQFYFEDISYFILEKCSDEIIKFLWENEPLKNKWYYSNGSGDRDYGKYTLLMSLSGDIHYSELLNLKNQVNTICYYYGYYPHFATLYDELHKEIESCKKEGYENRYAEERMNYVKSIGGKSFYDVFRGLSEAEKEKLINEYKVKEKWYGLYTVTVNTDALRLRDDCGLSSKVVGRVVNGDVLYVLDWNREKVEIDGITDHWYLVYGKGKGFGYCFGGYLKRNEEWGY